MDYSIQYLISDSAIWQYTNWSIPVPPQPCQQGVRWGVAGALYSGSHPGSCRESAAQTESLGVTDSSAPS